MAKKTLTYFLFFIFLTVFSSLNILKADCKPNDTYFASVVPNQISIIIHHQAANGNVTLKKMNFPNGDFAEEGKFKFIGNETFTYNFDLREPNFFIIDFFGKNNIELVLSPGQKVTIDIDLLSPDKFYINGSTDSDNFNRINARRNQIKDSLVNPIIKNLIKAQKENDSEKIKKLTKLYLQKNEILKQELKKQLKTAEIPVMIYASLKFFDIDEDINFLDSLSNELLLNNSNLKLVKYFRERIKKAKQLTIGAAAPDISLPDQRGNLIDLTSLKGQYVLVDFWASWNKQCRINNKEYQNIYKKFKTRGFDIYSISLDENKNKWMEAVKNDVINWISVSDLRGFNSDAVLQYNVTKLPQNFLLDREGHIVAKNLTGRSLENKLSEILK